MADYIPFVNSQGDAHILRQHYADASSCRVSLDAIRRVRSLIPRAVGLWIDPAVDAYHHILSNQWPVDVRTESSTHIAENWPQDEEGKKKKEWKFKLWQRWNRQFKSFPNYRLLTCDGSWKKTHEADLNTFVAVILDECLTFEPRWITIPQLPLGKGRSRVNKRLAQAAGVWRKHKSRDLDTGLILPLIVTTAVTLNTKPSRDKTVRLACECYTLANADGVWAVDTSLNDQARNEQFPARYEKLIAFHEGIRQSLPARATKVGGPYWGINLVLWARGLCDFPAISLGTSYTYHISCGPTSQGNVRLAIPPLRRWTIANADLAAWLDAALEKLNQEDAAYNELSRLRQRLATLSTKNIASNQVARFYKEWFAKIQSVSPQGRALALYQDLSSAFVLGRQLPQLPKAALPGAPRKVLEPGEVAKQLMLHCL